MIRNLILSGGGTYCAFQAGAVRALVQEHEYDYDRIVGVSGGALNAAYLAQAARQDDSLHNLKTYAEGLSLLWTLKIRKPSDVYRMGWMGMVGPFLPRWLGGGRPSFYDFTPLRVIIEENVSLPALRKSGRLLRVGTYDLPSARYIEWTVYAQRFLDKVFASAMIPGVAAPQVLQEEQLALVDGGLKDIAPTRSAFENKPDEIHVIVTTPLRVDVSGMPEVVPDVQGFDAWKRPTFGQVAQRAVSALCDEVLVGDLRRAAKANQRLLGSCGEGYAEATGKRYVDLKILAPDVTLDRSKGCLDFDAQDIAERLEHGWQMGESQSWSWPPPGHLDLVTQ